MIHFLTGLVIGIFTYPVACWFIREIFNWDHHG